MRSIETIPHPAAPPGGPPQDFAGLRGLILARAPALPRRLGQIARFAAEHPDEMALGTVAAIAERAGVPPSALVRFAQSLGYRGFSELQGIFRLHLRDAWPGYRARLAALREGTLAADGPAQLLDRFAAAAAASLERLRHGTDPAALERAAGILAAAETILVLGQRRSFPVAAYFAYTAAKSGLRAVLLDNVGSLLPEQASIAGPRDAALLVSFAPYTPTTVETAHALRAAGITLVVVTDSAFSPLAPLADVWLEVAEGESGAFRSLAASLTLALTLAVAAAEAREARG